jgi:hypothetical protein
VCGLTLSFLFARFRVILWIVLCWPENSIHEFTRKITNQRSHLFDFRNREREKAATGCTVIFVTLH